MSIRVTFLGTSGAVPTTERNPSSVMVQREGERLLFDAGEGTQRQMMRFGAGFDVSHLFVTHLHGDHVLGIPGLVQTWDFNDRDDPLVIHVPPGIKSEIKRLVTATGVKPTYPVRVVETPPGDVAYRTDDYEVRTFATDHRTTSVGYALVEDDRKGRFDREKAEDLGVPVGPKFSELHAGNAVELDDGTVVEPEQVVGPPRPGRRIVYTGDTRPIAETVTHAQEADLLVHDATFTADASDRASQTGHSTAAEAAEIAARADAKRLALTHISSRYAGDASQHKADAESAFDGTVWVATDGQEIEVPYPESGAGTSD